MKNKILILLSIIAIILVMIQWVYGLPNSAELQKNVPHIPFGIFEAQFFYLWINLGIIFFPLILSFDKKVAFYKNWVPLFKSITIVGLFFILWDIFFTYYSVWGFNSQYYYKKILGLPLGEILFFITVPYACVFIYECLKHYFAKFSLEIINSKIFLIIGILFFLGGTVFFGKIYTSSSFYFSSAVLFYIIITNQVKEVKWFLPAYVISWIPFIIINGLLTGYCTSEPLVMYNSSEFSNIRLGSIPIDDSIYSFLLLLLNIILFEKFKK